MLPVAVGWELAGLGDRATLWPCAPQSVSPNEAFHILDEGPTRPHRDFGPGGTERLHHGLVKVSDAAGIGTGLLDSCTYRLTSHD